VALQSIGHSSLCGIALIASGVSTFVDHAPGRDVGIAVDIGDAMLYEKRLILILSIIKNDSSLLWMPAA
jgi:hypothetical protein